MVSTWSFRLKSTLIISIPLFVIVFVSIFYATHTFNKFTLQSKKDDDRIVRRIYKYHNIASRYDSVVVGCMFGEMFIPNYGGNNDSLQIEWVNRFPMPGRDTSASYINQNSKSKAFNITDTTSLTLFRMIYMKFLDASAHYSLTDTTVWTMELWNAYTNTKIATIDSVGICRAINLSPSQFPKTFGHYDSRAYEVITISLSSYASAADSAYLYLKVKSWDTNQEAYCTIYDDYTVNTKFSETIGLQKRNATANRDIQKGMELSSFPNPFGSSGTFIKLSLPQEQYVELNLYSIDGKLIDRLIASNRHPGIYIIPYRLSNSAAGVYYLTASGGDGKVLSKCRIVFSN